MYKLLLHDLLPAGEVAHPHSFGFGLLVVLSSTSSERSPFHL